MPLFLQSSKDVPMNIFVLGLLHNECTSRVYRLYQPRGLYSLSNL